AHWGLGLGSVLTSPALGRGAGLATLGLPSRGSGAAPGGNSSGPFMPQAARLKLSKTAAILDIGDGFVSKERDVSTRWMTRNSTAWPMPRWPGSRRRWRPARPISILNWRPA